MIYVVLGMHKSGTTLVSEILHNSGINMVEQADPDATYESGNQYERLATLSCNKDLLSVRGLRSIDPLPSSANVDATDQQISHMQQIIDECSNTYTDWGFKDPRTCLTYELWKDLLPAHKIVVVYRDYKEVLAHYRKKYRRRLWSLIPFTRVLRVLRTWNHYNQKIIDTLQSTDRPYIVINYRALMSDDQEFHKLAEFVDAPLVDMRKVDLYRSHPSRASKTTISEAFAISRLDRSPVEVTEALEAIRSSQQP